MGKNASRKTSDVQKSLGQMGQCLQEEIEEILALVAGSTQVSRRLTWLDYCCHVNAYKHLNAKGLPAEVI